MRDITSAELLQALDHRITPRQLQNWIRNERITIDTPSPGSGRGRAHRFSPAEARAIADLVDMTDRVNTGAYYQQRLLEHLSAPVLDHATEIMQAIYDAHYPGAIAGRGEGEHALRFALQELVALLGAAGALIEPARLPQTG